MGRWLLGVACLFLVLGFAACGGDDDGGGGGKTVGGGTTGGADPMATPKGSIQYQLKLIKAQKVDELKACFTERLRDRISPESVARGATALAGSRLDDLFASATKGERDGLNSAKVKMKNGRTLTTLVLTDGKWLADTIWFK